MNRRSFETMAIAVVVACTLAAAACDRRPAAGHDGTSAVHDGADSEGHDHGGDDHDHSSWGVTAWGERHEVFAECDPLLAGQAAVSHTHVTVLENFAPLRQGTVSAILRGIRDDEHVFTQTSPTRDGIFSIELHPPVPGRFMLAFRIEDETGDELIDAGIVEVGEGHPGGLVRGPRYGAPEAATESDGSQAVSFLKEQQWLVPFRTAWARTGSIQAAVSGPARVCPAAGAEAVLTAPLDGIVVGDSRLYVGREVARDAVLLHLAPRASASRTLAELEAETDVAQRRLVRLEELLALEAVSRAEVEAARARVTALAAQLQAARGSGGARSPVRAPFAGEIAEVRVIAGQAVTAGQALVRVVRTVPLWFEVALPPQDVATLDRESAGIVVRATGVPPLAVPAGETRLVSVSPEVDPATGKVKAIVEVRRRIPIRIGMVVEVEILVADERHGIVVPASSVVDDGGVSVVYVQVGGETFERRQVGVLGRQADRMLVEGLVAEERVVTTGGPTIRRHSLMATGPVEGHVH